MSADSDCLFCKIIAGEIPSDKVYEDEHVYAFRDINPQAPAHILIIPREHRSGLNDYSEADALALGRVQAAAVKIAAAEGLESYRCVYNCGRDAGQEVFHLHLHLLGGRGFSWPPG